MMAENKNGKEHLSDKLMAMRGMIECINFKNQQIEKQRSDLEKKQSAYNSMVKDLTQLF